VSDNKLVAETRTQFGKGAARKIRRDHKIPAVMYGHGAEPVHITLPGHDTREQHGATDELEHPGQLGEQQPGEQHREEHLGEADERRQGRPEQARSEDAEHVGERGGHDDQLGQGQPRRDAGAGDLHGRVADVHGQDADQAERGEGDRADGEAEPGERGGRDGGGTAGEHVVPGQAGGREQPPEHPGQGRGRLAGDVEDEGEPDQRQHDADPGEAVRPLPGERPHPQHHEHDAEVLDEQGDADVHPRHRLEVAQLGRGDGERAVERDPGQLVPDRPPLPAQAPQREGQQEQCGAGDPGQHDRTRRPAGHHQRLGERAGGAEGRAGREHGDQAQPEVSPHRLDHGALPCAWLPDGAVRSKVCCSP
jgi:hypothetical protein